jgi:hypothetical protein
MKEAARTPSTTGAAGEVEQSPPPVTDGFGPRTAQKEHPGRPSSRRQRTLQLEMRDR